MKNESTCSRAVCELFEEVYKLYDRSETTNDELSKFPAILRTLLENGGADHIVRYRDHNMGTILHKLPRSRSRHTHVREMLAVLANLPLTGLSDLIVAVNDAGTSFLHHSFESHSFRTWLEPLLPRAIEPLITICNMQDDNGNIPLHIWHQDRRVFNFLLEHTKHPFTLNYKQRTPLHTLMAEFSSWDLDGMREDRLHRVRLLLHSGDVQEVKSVRDAEGYTLLHLWPWSDVQGLRELTKPQYGFLTLIDAQDAEGRTPLVHAISRGCCWGGAHPDPEYRSSFSPSMWFAAEHFILCGANVRINDRFGRNALHWLLDAVDECIQQHRAEFCKETVAGYTVIRALRDCRMARRLTTRMLMKGVGVDDQDVDGTSPKSLAEDYWDRWEKFGIFKPCRWITDPGHGSFLVELMSPGSYNGEVWADREEGIIDIGVEYQEAISPELARLRSDLRGSGLDGRSSREEWAEVICKIIKGDLETLVNAIKNKSTNKRKRDSISGSGSVPRGPRVLGAPEFAGSGITM